MPDIRTTEISREEHEHLKLQSRRLEWFLRFVELSGGMKAVDSIKMADNAHRLGHSPADAAEIARKIGSARSDGHSLPSPSNLYRRRKADRHK